MSDRIAGRLPDGTPVTFDEAGRVMSATVTFSARPQIASDAEMAAAVKRALEAPPKRNKRNKCDLCGEAFGRIHVCPEPTVGSFIDMPRIEPDPADQRIIAWMPTEYMEAARAGGQLPDAPEAKPEPECGAWLISPSSLPGCMRNGAQDGKGKAKGRTMVYDFEEVP